LAAAAAGTFARPYIANAQAKTGTIWWAQGFVPEEDAALNSPLTKSDLADSV